MRISLLILIVLLITACTQGPNTTKVEQKLESLRTHPTGKLEALPTTPNKQVYSYDLEEEREPFTPSSTASLLQTQASQLQPLQKYELSQLSFRGSMQKGPQIFVLILTPNNQLHRATLGSKLGRNQGEIIELTKEQLIVKEFIPQGKQLIETFTQLQIAN